MAIVVHNALESDSDQKKLLEEENIGAPSISTAALCRKVGEEVFPVPYVKVRERKVRVIGIGPEVPLCTKGMEVGYLDSLAIWS